MRKFTVTWHNAAIDELASAWLDSTHRSVLAKAVTAIDDTLAHDPSTKGIDFYGDRLLVILPLAVVFAVNPEDRLVRVLAVWTRQRYQTPE